MDAEISQDKHGNVDYVHIELTRTNLMTLLTKLDGHPPNSECAIFKTLDTVTYMVKGVPDLVHYSDRPRGMMHPDTERAMIGMSNHYSKDEDDDPCECGHCNRS